MKLDQRGFTLVELLVSLGILAVVTPLLATGMFQILTSTERGRAGFEAQADTRNASAWMSQDIVMAQQADIPGSNTGCTNTLATFAWEDFFGDPGDVPKHTVSYCLEKNPSGENQLLRYYDCGVNPIVIGRNMDSVNFSITALDDSDPFAGQEVTIEIRSQPVRNRFQVTDTKIVQVKMRPMPASPDPC